ncbi:MAG TPA: hypothetical protein VII21_04080 [Aestuariivirga sp.]
MKVLVTLILALLTLSGLPALAQDKPKLRVISEVSLDMNGDGKLDRIAVVSVGATDNPDVRDDGSYWLGDKESVDLYFYMDNGDKALDLSTQPSFIKKNIVDPESTQAVSPLVQKGKASIKLDSCYGCGASVSQEESLTIVYRNGEFLVAGFSLGWEDNAHPSDGDVVTTSGGCDINFLTGHGFATQDPPIKPKLLKQKFAPIKLADWSTEKYPKACANN